MKKQGSIKESLIDMKTKAVNISSKRRKYMIIEGCILIVLSVLTVIFSLATQNVQVKNGLKKVDGVITVSDIQNQEVTVEYTIIHLSIVWKHMRKQVNCHRSD